MQYAWKIVGTGVPDGPWHHVVSEFRALRELDDDNATIPESRLWRDEGVAPPTIKPTDTLFALSNNDNVIYLNTFSKTISPSLRIGYMVLPKHLVKTYEEKLGFYSCTVPTFMQ